MVDPPAQKLRYDRAGFGAKNGCLLSTRSLLGTIVGHCLPSLSAVETK